jgi:fructose-bisphosphate aldolase class I
MNNISNIAKELIKSPKGILAADESVNTANKRLESIGLAGTLENRRRYRELLLTAPGLNQYISGVILYDETLKDSTNADVPFVKILSDAGIVVGIKVDEGTVPVSEGSNEVHTKGLDGLAERLEEYKKYGAQFTKWRAVYTISDTTPSDDVIEENAVTLAAYAKVVQEAGMVPIVEPEVLMDGRHSIAECAEVTTKVLTKVFEALRGAGVDFEGMILKPNMVVPGIDGEQVPAKTVATKTLEVLQKTVPSSVPGIAFLSGGQEAIDANARLRAMNTGEVLPWRATFSFSRALMMNALNYWKGDDAKNEEAQTIFLKTARSASQASIGK